MGAIGIKILEILRKLYGSDFVSKTIGTRANVVKPKQFDSNAPTKNIYSKDAFRDSKLQGIDDEKIQEYAPFIFSNRNQRELMNFLENAEQLLKQKKKDFGVTEQLEKVKAPKVEAEVVDIKTGKKAEGIETLKEDLGLPPEVDPKSQMGKALLESKRNFKAMDDDMDDTLGKAVDAFFGARNVSKTFNDGRRRPIIRQILAEEDIIQKNLSEDDYDSLLFGYDLNKNADPNKDPFVYLNKYFVRDDDQLDMLDTIIDEMPGSTPAEISAEFKKRTGGLKPKDEFIQRESLDDEAVEMEETKMLDDDDPKDLATGGRVGFKGGLSKQLIDKLLKENPELKLASDMDVPENVLLKRMFEDMQKRINTNQKSRKDNAGGGLNYLMGL